MLELPKDDKKLVKLAIELVEQCRSSIGARASYYRAINAIAETGRSSGQKSLMNLMNVILSRTTGHLYSPTELRFSIDFDNQYDRNTINRAGVAAQQLTRNFNRSMHGAGLGTDMMFGQGVYESLKYGACLLKQWPQRQPNSPTNPAQSLTPRYNARLVMPWQFGVYREDLNELESQPVLCETTMMTLPEVWARIAHLPDAERLYKRIAENASDGGDSVEGPDLSAHPILPGSQLSLNDPNTVPGAGGIVQLWTQADYSVMGPTISVPMVKFHELWVQGQEDYTTIQFFEPDILIAPLYKHTNLLTGGDLKTGLQPYTLIQPNMRTGIFWGLSELNDLIQVQQWLTTTADDVNRLFGLQVDKILGFIGFEGMKDEQYDNFRSAGYMGLPQGADIKDITPKFPPEAMPMLKMLIDFINLIGGYPNLMLGQGDAGVRSGVQTDALLKTGSPRLRTQSLTVERQCAMAADLRFSLMQIKDGRNYWTDGSDPQKIRDSSFLLADLPKDRHIQVDSHSSSPIFADDHEQLIAFGIKAGFLDGEDAIDDLPYPEKEKKKQRLRDRQAAAAKNREEMLAQYPQLAETIAKKSITGR